MTTYGAYYNNIADTLLRGQLGLLIGSGMSTEAGIWSGSDMAKRMLRCAALGAGQEENENYPSVDALASRFPFEAISHLLEERLDYHSFPTWLDEKAGLKKKTPADSHLRLRELHTLVTQRFPKTLFTTNFDTLIEDAFGENEALCLTSENLNDLAPAREAGKVIVVHLHGCVRFPKSIITGEIPQATLEGALASLLNAALATDVFVMVGYSLSDTNLRDAFFNIQRIAEARKSIRKRTYCVSWVAGDPSDSASELSIATALWKLRNVDLIPVWSKDFFRSLYEAADNFVASKIRNEVAKALGKDPATLDRLLETVTQPFDILKPFDLLLYLYYSLSPTDRRL